MSVPQNHCSDENRTLRGANGSIELLGTAANRAPAVTTPLATPATVADLVFNSDAQWCCGTTQASDVGFLVFVRSCVPIVMLLHRHATDPPRHGGLPPPAAVMLASA